MTNKIPHESLTSEKSDSRTPHDSSHDSTGNSSRGGSRQGTQLAKWLGGLDWQLHLVSCWPDAEAAPSPALRARTAAYERLLRRRPDIAAEVQVSAPWVADLLRRGALLEQCDVGLQRIAQQADDGMRLIAGTLGRVIGDIWTGLAGVTGDQRIAEQRRAFVAGLWREARRILTLPPVARKLSARSLSRSYPNLLVTTTRQAPGRRGKKAHGDK